MKSSLDSYLDQLKVIFRENDYRVAHEKAKSILLSMAKDKSVLFDIIRQNLSAPGFFSQKRINPVIAFEIIKNKDFSITAHCWMPLPDRATNMTHQSVHHHGRLLLTSVSPFGEGYESIIFKKGFELNKEQGTAKMQIEKIYKNPCHNIEFIDSFTPHVVFYPSDFSITYAMWSYDKKDGLIATLRQSKFMQSNKKIVMNVLRKLGVLNRIGVNVLEYFDFYPEKKQLNALKDRVMYPVGSNENFVHNVFYILQRVGFDDLEFIKKLKTQLPPEERTIVEKPTNQFLNGEPLQDLFDPVHLNIPKINFSKEELLNSVR
ncbi:MAG: hypothetical protein M3342_18905 [Bacteroidota bacterium]|nr:hypothetical protein [Bacteroidota bacterium]